MVAGLGVKRENEEEAAGQLQGREESVKEEESACAGLGVDVERVLPAPKKQKKTGKAKQSSTSSDK